MNYLRLRSKDEVLIKSVYIVGRNSIRLRSKNKVLYKEWHYLHFSWLLFFVSSDTRRTEHSQWFRSKVNIQPRTRCWHQTQGFWVGLWRRCNRGSLQTWRFCGSDRSTSKCDPTRWRCTRSTGEGWNGWRRWDRPDWSHRTRCRSLIVLIQTKPEKNQNERIRWLRQGIAKSLKESKTTDSIKDGIPLTDFRTKWK